MTPIRLGVAAATRAASCCCSLAGCGASLSAGLPLSLGFGVDSVATSFARAVFFRAAFFAVAYVFVIMEIGSRRIVHANVTCSPSLLWVKQQIREATPWGPAPRVLVHDNDGIFGQYGRRVTVERSDGMRSYRCHLDHWLGERMEIEGIPIPHGSPNASPHVERFNRALREEALNHFFFLSPRYSP